MQRKTVVLIVLLLILIGQPLLANENKPADPVPVPPRVALVLAGGGAMGFSHLGVIELIEELGIPVDMVVGTSIGSIVGGLYAMGYTADELHRVIRETDWIELFVDPPPRSVFDQVQRSRPFIYTGYLNYDRSEGLSLAPGLISGQGILNRLGYLTKEAARINDFDSLPRVFRAVATDLGNGEEVVLAAGSLASAMRASMAIPGIFEPYRINGRLLVDGGIVNNLPTDIARQLGADIVIAVDLDRSNQQVERIVGIGDVLSSSMQLITGLNRAGKTELADIVIAPDLEGLHAASFDQIVELIERGRRAAALQREAIEKLAADIRPLRESTVKPERLKDLPIKLTAIVINGVDKKEQQFVLRALGLSGGGSYSAAGIHEAVSAVNSARRYHLVRYRLQPGESENGGGSRGSKLIIDIEAHSQAMIRARAGFFFHSHFSRLPEEDLVLYLEATLPDLVGEGSSAGIEIELGLNIKSLLYFHLPVSRFLYLRQELGYSHGIHTLHYSADPSQQYASNGFLAETRLGLILPRFVHARLAAYCGYVQMANRYGLDGSIDDSGSGLFGLSADLGFDSLDRFPYPSRGLHWIIGYRQHLALGASELEYGRLFSDWRHYLALKEHHSLGYRGRLAADLHQRAPLWDWIRAGGMDDVFGYNRRELSAAQLASCSVVYRYRVQGLPEPLQDRFYVSLHADAGLYSDELVVSLPRLAELDAYELFWGTGLSVGVLTPLGAVRLAGAWRADRRVWVAVTVGNFF